MGVIETRAKVSIIDGASSGLNSMASANERLTSSLGKSASAAKNFSVNLRAHFPVFIMAHFCTKKKLWAKRN